MLKNLRSRNARMAQDQVEPTVQRNPSVEATTVWDESLKNYSRNFKKMFFAAGPYAFDILGNQLSTQAIASVLGYRNIKEFSQ